MGTIFGTWCSNTANWTQATVQSLEIPAGTMTGIFNSAVLSFGTNMAFSRCDLDISLKGAGIAVLAKLVQMTLTVAQTHLLKEKQLTEYEKNTKPSRLTSAIVSVQNLCSKPAAFVCHYLKKLPLPVSVSPLTAYRSVHPDDWYTTTSLIMFSLRKITSPAIDPWTTLLSTLAFGKMSDLSNAAAYPFCVVLKRY